MPHRKVIEGIAKAMGTDVEVAKGKDVKKLIKAFDFKISPSPFEKRDDLTASPEDLIPEINKAMIRGSSLSWLTEHEN